MATPLNRQRGSRATALTLMHPIRPGRAAQLREALQHLCSTVMRGMPPIYAVQWVMFDNDTRLLCSLHVEGTLETLIQDFAIHRTEQCRHIWGNCIGYPDGDAHTIDAIVAYLIAGQVPVSAYFPRRNGEHR